MAGKRTEDPNAVVQVTVKIPNRLRNMFKAVALLKGDNTVAKRLEKLIREDVESVFPETHDNGFDSTPVSVEIVSDLNDVL